MTTFTRPGTSLKEPIYKNMMRSGWSLLLGLHCVLSIFTCGRPDVLRVYFGGARPGDVGGPLVKIKRLRQLFREAYWSYNLVYVLSNTPYLPDFALRCLKWRKVPIVHNQNGIFNASWYDGDWRLMNKRMARTFHQADYVFYQSEFCRNAAERFCGHREGPGEVLYNAVDTKFFTPGGATWIAGERRFRFLLTGKITQHLYYRLESTTRGLAEAVLLGLNCELRIAGWVGEEPRRRVLALAAQLGISDRVCLTGPYRQEDAPEIYQWADSLVMTKHNDPCPNTVLEAMACGLAVLYSNTGGVPELVGDCGIALNCEQSWTAIHVPEITDIAAGMVEIAPLTEDLGAAARVRAVDKFDIAFWCMRHKEVFANLVKQ